MKCVYGADPEITECYGTRVPEQHGNLDMSRAGSVPGFRDSVTLALRPSLLFSYLFLDQSLLPSPVYTGTIYTFEITLKTEDKLTTD